MAEFDQRSTAGEVPPTLLTAARRVAEDLKHASGTEPAISFAPAPDADDAWRVTAVFADGFEAGFEVVIDDGCELVVSVADGLQQALIEALREAVPVCPQHAHPLEPACPNGRNAVWLCPATGEAYNRIGELALEPGSTGS